jgi:3-deoxy-manno-octulosonate cytidylyltransferase (CMP-KDO synthetase)
MVVRVAQAAQRSGAEQVVVACDHPRIQAACAQHGVLALLTRADHPSGSDRLAEAVGLLGLADDALVVNVQGDEPLIDPAMVRDCAATAGRATRLRDGHRGACHRRPCRIPQPQCGEAGL